MEVEKELGQSERGQRLFEEHLHDHRSKLDRLFSVLLLVQWVAAVVVALVWSPIGWADKQQVASGHLALAILAGGILALAPLIMTRLMPGSRLTRHAMAAAQMMFSALFIHLSGGRIETHFHVFGSLAWLAFYLDWQILLTATITVALDHAVRGIVFSESVYGMVHAGHWRFVEHALWVVFEDIVLFIGCHTGVRSMLEGAEKQAQLEAVTESEQNK